MALPSVALRSTNLHVLDSGQGSVSTRDIVGELSRLVDEFVSGRLVLPTREVPLADVEATWTDGRDPRRVVFVP